MDYNTPLIQNTVCRIAITMSKDGWSKYKLEIDTGNSYSSKRMSGPGFRRFFGGIDAKDTTKLIEQYNGKWPQKSFMSIEFDNMEDAKLFVDDIITPKLLIFKVGGM